MSAHQTHRPVLQPVARKLALRRWPHGPCPRLALAALLAALLALPLGAYSVAHAANTLPASHAKLVQPSSTGDAKIERRAVVKLHAQTVATPVQHPGKTVGGNRTPHARTIVTKRILPP
jgi:hypothetical protein